MLRATNLAGHGRDGFGRVSGCLVNVINHMRAAVLAVALELCGSAIDKRLDGSLRFLTSGGEAKTGRGKGGQSERVGRKEKECGFHAICWPYLMKKQTGLQTEARFKATVRTELGRRGRALHSKWRNRERQFPVRVRRGRA